MNMISDTFDVLKIIPIALKAGELILEVYNSDFSVEFKEDNSPLTLADQRLP